MKILFLDSWTKGIRMFLPVSDYLRERNIDSLLVHWGSWDAEPGRPKEEYIDGLLCRDISYYRTRLLHKVFKQENPDCIVTLTTTNLIDRAKILAARAMGIPSVFLMHGIIAATEPVIDAQISVMQATLRRKRFSKLPKHFEYILPNYFQAGIASDPKYLLTREPYRVLWHTFLSPQRWKMYPAPSRELQCDLCLAWGRVYRDFLAEAYGYSLDSILVTGHPPLDSAHRLAASAPDAAEISGFLRDCGVDDSKPLAVYLEGAFVKSEYEGWTNDSLIKHLTEVAELCEQAGKTLVIKLHPNAEYKDLLAERLAGRATVLQAVDSDMLLYAAESVIAHSSTLINTAIVFNRPVLVPRWGISEVIPPNFDETGAVAVCNTPEALLRNLMHPDETRQRLQEGRRKYVEDYLAPLDGNSQRRICEAIENLARASGK